MGTLSKMNLKGHCKSLFSLENRDRGLLEKVVIGVRGEPPGIDLPRG